MHYFDFPFLIISNNSKYFWISWHSQIQDSLFTYACQCLGVKSQLVILRSDKDHYSCTGPAGTAVTVWACFRLTYFKDAFTNLSPDCNLKTARSYFAQLWLEIRDVGKSRSITFWTLKGSLLRRECCLNSFLWASEQTMTIKFRLFFHNLKICLNQDSAWQVSTSLAKMPLLLHSMQFYCRTWTCTWSHLRSTMHINVRWQRST